MEPRNGRRFRSRRLKTSLTILLGPLEDFTPEHRTLFMHAADVAAAERHVRGILRLPVASEVP